MGHSSYEQGLWNTLPGCKPWSTTNFLRTLRLVNLTCLCLNFSSDTLSTCDRSGYILYPLGIRIAIPSGLVAKSLTPLYFISLPSRWINHLNIENNEENTEEEFYNL